MDIKALQWELAAFVVDRGLDPLQTPKNLAMALAAEAGTLLAFFKWLDDDGPALGTPAKRSAAGDALADSVLHAIHLADRLGIDLEEAIRRKLARNAEKYPVTGGAVAAAPASAPVTAAPERRVAPDRRAGPDRRVAPERRFEPERRAGADRRAESDRRASRGRVSAEPEPPVRIEQPPAPVPPPPPLREAPPATRVSQPLPVEARAPIPPPRPVRPEAPRARIPEPPPPPLAPAPPVARFEPPPPVARFETPPPVARAEPPSPPLPEPEPEPEVDPYADLDLDAARRLVEVLSKQTNRARSDDPLARELHDELTTLKRTLYADNPKRAWLAGSLRSIRRILDEAAGQAVGAELRAKEHLAEVERILDV